MSRVLVLDIDRLTYGDRHVRISGQAQILTRLFLDNPNRLLTFDRLGDELYRGPADSPLDLKRLLSVVMMRIRNALSSVGLDREVIQNVRGQGYVFRSGMVDPKTATHMTDLERATINAAVDWRQHRDDADEALSEAIDKLTSEREDD